MFLKHSGLTFRNHGVAEKSQSNIMIPFQGTLETFAAGTSST